MMILFLFCGYGVNNGGGTFAFIEVLMAMSMDDNEKLENLVLLFAIAGQIAGLCHHPFKQQTDAVGDYSFEPGGNNCNCCFG